MNITLDSKLKLVPLEIRKDKKHYIVENLAFGEFYEMPVVCTDAIQLIYDGVSLGKIEMQLKEKYPEEEVDILDFANQLLELQLISEVDGNEVVIREKRRDSLGFLAISPKLGKFFFNKTSLIFYTVLFSMNVLFFILKPNLFPHFKDIFVFDLMVFNIPTWMLLSAVLVLVHEFGHILAVRAYNLPTRLEISNRLFLVVLETDMAQAWKLPPKDRNVLYLAGLCFDTTILFFALGSQLIFPDGSGIFLSFMKLIALDTLMRMVYQCCFYMKTDLYYVFENVTGAYNLMENANQAIRNKLPFLKDRKHTEVVFASEKRIVTTYTFFYFIGVGLTVLLFVGYFLPQLVFAMTDIRHCFGYGPSSHHFWNAVLSTLQLLIGVLLLLYSWRKKFLVDKE
jgi:putative peptide zinc metalloprotease protein